MTDGTPASRLKVARERAGHDTAAAAARAIGVVQSTYLQHENGIRPIPAKRAALYAEKFGVLPEWILFGSGEEGVMEAALSNAPMQPRDASSGPTDEPHSAELRAAMAEFRKNVRIVRVWGEIGHGIATRRDDMRAISQNVFASISLPDLPPQSYLFGVQVRDRIKCSFITVEPGSILIGVHRHLSGVNEGDIVIARFDDANYIEYRLGLATDPRNTENFRQGLLPEEMLDRWVSLKLDTGESVIVRVTRLEEVEEIKQRRLSLEASSPDQPFVRRGAGVEGVLVAVITPYPRAPYRKVIAPAGEPDE